MSGLNFILKGFGYKGLSDFGSTLFRADGLVWVVSVGLGTFRMLLLNYTGLDLVVFLALVFLIGAEFQTGLRVSTAIKGERFQSRKFGRMFLKIGTYITILLVLFSFASRVKVPDIFGFEPNPFMWLYYVVFTGIVLQLVISWFENLGCLGYKETKTLAGFVLRKFNRWFEFDGSKDNGCE